MKMPYFKRIILLLSSLFITSTITTNPNIDFIKNSCGVTMYQDLCYQTLSPYANRVQSNPTLLANAALNVTLQNAESTAKYFVSIMKSKSHNLKAKEAVAMKDCVETLKDSVEELRESLDAMRDLEGPDFELKMSNVQTWVSAALTDEDTCLNGLEGKFVNRDNNDNDNNKNSNNNSFKVNLRSCLERVAQLTSNALALVNHIV